MYFEEEKLTIVKLRIIVRKCKLTYLLTHSLTHSMVQDIL